MPKIITRRVGESIQVGPDTVIRLNKISGKRATIAVEAPEDVRINRLEGKEMLEVMPPVDWEVIALALEAATGRTQITFGPQSLARLKGQLAAVEYRINRKSQRDGLQESLLQIDAGD